MNTSFQSPTSVVGNVGRIVFDCHVHTRWSPCSLLKPADILSSPLDAVVITDHGTTLGAQEVLEYQRANISRYAEKRVYLGIEFRTEYGEFNALFLDLDDCDAFERMRNSRGRFGFAELVQEIDHRKRQGKLLMTQLNHPFCRLGPRGGFDFDGVISDGVFPDLSALVAFFDVGEVNGGNMFEWESQMMIQFAMEHGMLLLYNSDAHFRAQLGKCFTIGNRGSPRECIEAAREGDASALVIPDRFRHTWSWWYRIRSNLMKKVRKPGYVKRQ